MSRSPSLSRRPMRLVRPGCRTAFPLGWVGTSCGWTFTLLAAMITRNTLSHKRFRIAAVRQRPKPSQSSGSGPLLDSTSPYLAHGKKVGQGPQRFLLGDTDTVSSDADTGTVS